MTFSLRRFATSGFMVWMVIAVVGTYYLSPLREKLRFGIDLVGGTYITLGVQVEKAVESELFDRQEALEKKLKDARKDLPVTTTVENKTINFVFTTAAAAQDAAQVLKDEGRDVVYETHDTTLTVRLTERKEHRVMEDAVARNIEVLRTRLDKMSVAEITIAAKGDRQIIVELPDVADPHKAKAMIGTAAVLEFRLVEKEGRTPEDILYEYDGVLPQGMEILPGKSERSESIYYLVPKRADVTGKHLKDARPDFDQQTGDMVVLFTMTQDGGDRFYTLTSRNHGRQLAAILDGVVITAPRISEGIRSSGRITGTFTPAQAKELSLLLKSGSFVAPVTFEEERQVGPSLGAQAIRDGVISCLVGLVMLFLFSITFYSYCGLLAFITLLYNLLLLLLGLVWLRATLTLPGIAGMVLTVGMAIDASILIYERIREEIAAGVTIKKAVADGFSDAMRVILDANITTLIVGVILYVFGSGPIQGFAVTMVLGIISTLITGLFFLRSMFTVLLNNFDIQKLRI